MDGAPTDNIIISEEGSPRSRVKRRMADSTTNSTLYTHKKQRRHGTYMSDYAKISQLWNATGEKARAKLIKYYLEAAVEDRIPEKMLQELLEQGDREKKIELQDPKSFSCATARVREDIDGLFSGDEDADKLRRRFISPFRPGDTWREPRGLRRPEDGEIKARWVSRWLENATKVQEERQFIAFAGEYLVSAKYLQYLIVRFSLFFRDLAFLSSGLRIGRVHPGAMLTFPPSTTAMQMPISPTMTTLGS
jgi:hypothetical protein